VALVEDHVTVALLPEVTVVGLADKLMVGAGITVTPVLASADPPLPVQVSLKVALALSGPTVCVPETGLLPLQSPAAVQLLALVALQVRVMLEPESSVTRPLGVMVTTGAGVAAAMLTTAESALWPPGPEQVSV
jgi:hypothetical protein